MTIHLPPWVPTTPMTLLWLVVVALLLLFAMSWVLSRRHYFERGQQLINEFEDSTISHAVVHSGPMPAGFELDLEPAPDPFNTCRIRYRTSAAYNPLAWSLQLLSPPPERLTIEANLPSAPMAELIWHHDREPAAALGRSVDSTLWILRRLDFAGAEYVTRGPLTNGVQHVFSELQTRFNPFLLHIVVTADIEPHLTIVLDTARFDPAQAPRLLALVLAMGRSARIG